MNTYPHWCGQIKSTNTLKRKKTQFKTEKHTLFKKKPLQKSGLFQFDYINTQPFDRTYTLWINSAYVMDIILVICG